MFKCKICGKEFDAPTELGGHVSSAHPQRKDSGGSPEETVAVEQAGGVESEGHSENLPSVPEDGTNIMDNIRRLMRQGYTPKQITDRFGYVRRTVDQVVAEFIPPEGKPAEPDKDKEPGLPVTVRSSEIIPAEAIMQRLADGSDEWRLRLEGMMLLRAAQKMNREDVETARMQAEADARLIEPVLKLMKETREEQDAAAQRAKASGEEIAGRAAHETARQLYDVMTENNTRVTDAINSVRQSVGHKEENPLGQVLGMFQSMQQMAQMFGLKMPGMAPGQATGSVQQPWQPPPIKRHTQKEDVNGPDAENAIHP